MKRTEDGVWRRESLDDCFMLELVMPNVDVRVEWNERIYRLEMDRSVATKFLSIISNIIDDLLEDWYAFFRWNLKKKMKQMCCCCCRFPLIGTRFVHSSEGRLLVDRLIPCYSCANDSVREERTREKSYVFLW